MKNLRQIGAVCAINLASIPQRLGASLVVIAGIAGVVGVLVTVLALGKGLQETFAATGRPDRAIVVSKGASSESNSSLQRGAAFAILDAPGIKKDTDGRPILSMEFLTQIRVQALSDGVQKNISLRGLGPLGMSLRPEIHLVNGRIFRPGRHEIIVGLPLQAQFNQMKVGDYITIQNSRWAIVGSFATTSGGAHDSEILGDATSLLPVFHRTNFQSVTVQLVNPTAFKAFSAALIANPSISVEVHREDQWFADQSQGIIRLLTAVGYFVGGIMAIGAVFAALNTMYAAVSAQSLVIATLRAVGFNAFAVLTAIFLESMTLAAIGALAGTGLAWLVFNDHSLNMLSSAGNQTVFELHVSTRLAFLGVMWALIIGFFGGLPPAIRAARLPVADALRAT